ncbi:MAG: helix-turn-helix domain-containing protein [Actinomycetota bacterium]|nr:helix-turn-helix domain-containing protein [Actinomycetota bacterium]
MTQDTSVVSATVRRWQLTETLRELREQARLTHDQVIAELRKGQGKWSRPKLSRIENREQGVKTREVEQLLDVYGVSDQAVRDWLIELAGTAHERGWVVDIRKNLPQHFHTFLNWEVALVERREFETLLVPGLLQTAEYARALVTGIHPDLTEDEVERRVSARITRQQILTRTAPPHFHVILDAGVLERPVGGSRVMRNQLRRLTESADAPNITIQVLPKSTGASPALEGPFSILSLPEPMPDVGYVDGPGRAVYIEDRDEVRTFTLRFGILTEQSLSQADSVKLITDAVNSYE